MRTSKKVFFLHKRFDLIVWDLIGELRLPTEIIISNEISSIHTADTQSRAQRERERVRVRERV